MTIEELRQSGWIAYEYIRGSHMYHLNIETSDQDIGGVFICPQEYLMGLRSRYIEQIADKKNDTVFYEFGRWIELLLKSNPSALESLFAPKDCIIGDVHPAVQYIIDHRDMFLSKTCIDTCFGFAKSQIYKARGLNKKIVNPMTERKDILDFCYTFKKQGSQPMKDWLRENKLDQRYCGLVDVPNMHETYGVYYDFAAYFHFENIDWKREYEKNQSPYNKFLPHIQDAMDVQARIRNKEFYGYSGIVNPNEENKSNDVRLSSIVKGQQPICYMTFAKDAYISHCTAYREYKEWEEKRNPIRYESNLDKNYDSKNIMHCMRILRMAKELAQGKGFNVVRDADRDFLLDIRNHKFEYDEIMNLVEQEKNETEIAIQTCTLLDKADYDKINQLLLDARKIAYSSSSREERLAEAVRNVSKDKESAMKFLQNAGIVDENGKLSGIYR